MSSIPNFKEDVESLVHAFSDIENPFLENSSDLISLETSQIMPTDVVESVMTAKESGRKQCETFFFSERIITRQVAWSSLHLNKLALFSTKPQQCRNLK